MKKQEKVLKELYWIGKKTDINEILEVTEMSKEEIYEAIRHLKRRGLIKVTREIGKAGYKSPPKGKIYLEINYNSLKRIKNLIK